MHDKNILDKFIEDFAEIVEKHCKYIVVSGFLAIAHGRSRGTEDIDMIVEKPDYEKFKKMHADLVKSGFECLQSSDASVLYNDYLCKNISVRYIRKGFELPELELKFAKDELDALQIATRKKMPLTGLDIWFSSVEMNIAFKEELLKSDKDIKDALHLRLVYAKDINERLINDIKKMIKEMRLNRKNGK